MIFLASSCRRELEIKDISSSKERFQKVERSSNFITLKNKFFQAEFEKANPLVITKSADNKTRYLLSLKSNAEKKVTIFKYLLFEANSNGKIDNYCYIISKQILEESLNLNSFSIQRDSILFYEETLYPNSRNLNKKIKKKLVAKTLGKKIAPTLQFKKPCYRVREVPAKSSVLIDIGQLTMLTRVILLVRIIFILLAMTLVILVVEAAAILLRY